MKICIQIEDIYIYIYHKIYRSRAWRHLRCAQHDTDQTIASAAQTLAGFLTHSERPCVFSTAPFPFRAREGTQRTCADLPLLSCIRDDLQALLARFHFDGADFAQPRDAEDFVARVGEHAGYPVAVR